jgi:hypothetical protein
MNVTDRRSSSKPFSSRPEFLFHGGTAGLLVGEFILPASETGVTRAKNARSNPAKVYLATSADLALIYAVSKGDGHVYRVRGENVQPDPMARTLGVSWEADRAEVLEVIVPNRSQRRRATKHIETELRKMARARKDGEKRQREKEEAEAKRARMGQAAPTETAANPRGSTRALRLGTLAAVAALGAAGAALAPRDG